MRRLFSALLIAGTAWSVAADTPVQTTAQVRGAVTVTRKAPGHPDHADVAVVLRPVSGESAGPPASPPPMRRILQQNKKFTPHLLVVPVGTVVEFPNLDPFFHNAFSLFEGKRFDLGLYEGGASKRVTFGSVGVCYIFCNIHPEMSAVVVVVDTPYYAVSGRSGDFTIPEVPAGRYSLSVWHERNKPENPREFPREIVVPAGATQLSPIRMLESEQVIAPHMNKYGKDYTPPPATGYVIIR